MRIRVNRSITASSRFQRRIAMASGYEKGSSVYKARKDDAESNHRERGIAKPVGVVGLSHGTPRAPSLA